MVRCDIGIIGRGTRSLATFKAVVNRLSVYGFIAMSRISKRVIRSLWFCGVLGFVLCTQTTHGFALLQTNTDQQPQEINAIEILREASLIASRQDKEHSFWCDRVLLKIADVQTRSHDFDGAKSTLRNCTYPYGRNVACIELAKAHAEVGQRDRAFEVLQEELETDLSWNQDCLSDSVQAHWVDNLITTDKLESAQKAVDEMKVYSSRSEALCKLALAHAKRGDKATAKRIFLDASKLLSDQFSQVKFSSESHLAIDICRVALAQRDVVDMKTTSSMIQQLVQYSEISKSGPAKVRYLREAAVLAAKVGDQKTAKALFENAVQMRHAIQPPTPCSESNRTVALGQIAKAQTNVGFIDEALETVAMLKDDDSERGEALCDIAVAQAKAGNIAGGIETALSIEHYLQYQNDALLVIVDLFIEKGDKKSALATAEKILNPSRRTTAILKVATQHAKDGNKNKAKAIASQIKLEVAPEKLLFTAEAGLVSFDFTKPETWGIMFDEKPYFTSLSYSFTVNRAAELSAAVMTLHQALSGHQNVDFAVAFKDVHEDVIESLARAHAASGDPKAAYEWASRIGSDEKLEPDSDHDSQTLVEQRLHGLIGAAEGMLAKDK